MTPPDPDSGPQLARRLGLADAVVLGLGSMLGAGVFATFAPAAAAAGTGLLIALALAAIVAYCNAISSAQLAARYPESGGTYRCYGRHRLGPAWGFLAGWGFVIGKTASCAAMAMTFGAYTWPACGRCGGCAHRGELFRNHQDRPADPGPGRAHRGRPDRRRGGRAGRWPGRSGQPQRAGPAAG